MSLSALVDRATDPTLTADNWQYILDVCDSVASDPEPATPAAIALVSAKLKARDANVVLRALALVTALAENCGARMKQEIAARAFTDLLLGRLKDRKSHRAIKEKIVSVIGQLHQSFADDVSLKPVQDAYRTVQTQFRQYDVAPSKPAKEPQDDDDELHRAMQLSLQEYERQNRNKPLPDLQATPAAQAPKPEPEPEQQSVSKVRALYDLISYEPDELSFRKGDIITVIESVYRDWWRGSLASGAKGIFPLNYVTPVVAKSPQELAQELQQENAILQSDSRKVDRLLSLLSLPDANEDEITRLYNEVLPIRPALAKAIDKYSGRREELVTLNGSLNQHVKFFNEVVDNNINQKIRPPVEPNFLPYPNMTEQPTSSGFGNERYSNINNFPDVNNLR